MSGRPEITNGRPYPPCSGTQHVALEISTPGIAFRRSVAFATRSATASDFAYPGPDNDIRIVSTLVESKPGSTRASASAVRMRSADPTRRINASATSTITSVARARFCRRPVPDRPLASFSDVVRSVFDVCSAGSSPKSTPVTIETAIVKATTRQSSETNVPASPTRGRLAVFTDSSARMPTTPSARPSAPPITDRSRLSVRSCRRMRPRDPPIAARTAISRVRPVARASSRFATLAHAISRTSATAPSITYSVGRTFWTSTLRMGSTLKLLVAGSACGNFCRKSCADAFSRSFACSSETPGFSRAPAWK